MPKVTQHVKWQSWGLNAAPAPSGLGGSESIGSETESSGRGGDGLLFLGPECVPQPSAQCFLHAIPCHGRSSPCKGPWVTHTAARPSQVFARSVLPSSVLPSALGVDALSPQAPQEGTKGTHWSWVSPGPEVDPRARDHQVLLAARRARAACQARAGSLSSPTACHLPHLIDEKTETLGYPAGPCLFG